jgi:hypothetical protein
MNTLPNGRTRKNLADQIDRLDTILSGLSEALNESVAASVREATAQAVEKAVETTLRELLSSPELLTLIGSTRAPVGEPAPPPANAPASGLRGRVGSVFSWAGQKFRAARDACGRKLSGLRARLLALWGFRPRLLVALGAGAAVGLAAYVAGPLLAALFGAAVGFATSLAARARLWWKHMAARGSLATAVT